MDVAFVARFADFLFLGSCFLFRYLGFNLRHNKEIVSAQRHNNLFSPSLSRKLTKHTSTSKHDNNTMLRLFPHPPQSKDQPLARTISCYYILSGGFQDGALLGGHVSLPIVAVKFFKPAGISKSSLAYKIWDEMKYRYPPGIPRPSSAFRPWALACMIDSIAVGALVRPSLLMSPPYT